MACWKYSWKGGQEGLFGPRRNSSSSSADILNTLAMLAVAGGEWAGHGVSGCCSPATRRTKIPVNWRRRAQSWEVGTAQNLLDGVQHQRLWMWWHWEHCAACPLFPEEGVAPGGHRHGGPAGLTVEHKVCSWWTCGNAGHVWTCFSGELGSAGLMVGLGGLRGFFQP